MALKPVLLGFTKDFSKTSTPTKGDEATVTANVILQIDETITDHFNIPEAPVDAMAGVAKQLIAAFSYTRYKDFTDTTGTTVSVPEHERGVGKKNSRGRVVILPHATLKTTKGKPRTCSIRFPSFFNLLMIDQALGSMIKANAPSSWRLLNGTSYPFIANTTTGLRSGYSSGAWLATALLTPTNTGDTSAVGDVTVVAGKQKASA